MAALKQPPKHVAVTVSGQEILPALPAGQRYCIHNLVISRQNLSDSVSLLEGTVTRISVFVQQRVPFDFSFGPDGWEFASNDGLFFCWSDYLRR